MKQGFATAAVAGVTNALSISDMYNKFVYGGYTYRFREGAVDAASTQVIASNA